MSCRGWRQKLLPEAERTGFMFRKAQMARICRVAYWRKELHRGTEGQDL